MVCSWLAVMTPRWTSISPSRWRRAGVAAAGLGAGGLGLRGSLGRELGLGPGPGLEPAAWGSAGGGAEAAGAEQGVGTRFGEAGAAGAGRPGPRAGAFRRS
jgi:hypothetical protein